MPVPHASSDPSVPSAPPAARGGARAAPIAAALALILAGCAAVPTGAPPPSDGTQGRGDPPDGVRDTGAGSADVPAGGGVDRAPMNAARQRIVDDLADALAGALDPRTTTLQVNRDADAPMTLAFAEALSARGFGIQRVSADQGAYLLRQRRGGAWEEGATSWTLRAGPIELERDYRVLGNGTVVAVSPLRVAGTRAPIDPVRGGGGGGRPVPAEPGAERVEYVGPSPLETPPPLLSLITPEVVQGAVDDIVGAPTRTGVNSNRVEVRNLYFDDAAFAGIADTHRRVERRVLVFGDDSLVLGEDNRALIDDFVDDHVREQDVVGIVGCSNGPTNLAMGNEGLALGRAARVAEALVARGVPRERVRDEGCWAPTSAGDRFPGRGVVLELWRRVG